MEIFVGIVVLCIALFIMYSVYYSFHDIGFSAAFLINFITVTFINIVYNSKLNIEILVYSIFITLVLTLINKWIYSAIDTFKQYLALTILVVIILGIIGYVFSKYLIVTF